MQRVVRFSLAGALTIAGLTACGDKVTVPPPVQQAVDSTVHSVTVSPPSATIAVGGKIILAASVDAGPGVSNRTVTWTSSDNTVATVGTDGTVTGVKAGTVSITASSAANSAVKGAAAITVGGGNTGGPVTVTISSMNQTVCGIGGCNSVPANLAAVAGQLDVILNVDAGGQALKTVQATLTCGKQTMTRSQTVGAAASSATDAEAAQATVTLSFPTNEFNPTTGVPTLLNGPCTISASATTAGGTQSATNSQQFTLANPDAVIVNTTTNGNSASDMNGLPWKSGAVTVSALPVVYSGRTVSSVQITLPGASGPTQLIPAASGGATSATWANSTSGSVANKVGQLTLTGGVDANGFPVPVHPTVLVIDSNGNDINLAQANSLQQSDLRVDNQSPEAPLTFQIPQSQGQWVNGSYTFAGVGASAGTDAKYVSCGDGPTSTAANPQPACNTQIGVSAAPVDGDTGLNGQTTVTYYAIATASYPGTSSTGTSTSTSTCDVTGWTKIANAGDLAETSTNTAYVVRAIEADKLGNQRCTDISTNVNTINTTGGAFVAAKFGVDKTAPTAQYVEPSTNAAAAGPNQTIGIGQAVPSFMLAIADNASGFSATPVLTKLTRLAINPATGAVGTGSFACPIGFSSNSCRTARKGTTVAVDNGSGIDGYYTYTPIVTDLALNQTSLTPRQVVIDRQAPVMGGIAVPATINGGQSASFATSATDNLDLISTDYTLSYNVAVGGNAAPFNIRAAGPSLGTPFDNVLTTSSSFSLNVPFFIRSVAAVDANGAPQNGTGGIANQVAVRAYDAAGNVSNAGVSAINPANVNQTNLTNFSTLQPNGAQFLAFGVTTPATAISDCSPGNCAGGANPANPTSVNLTAGAIGTEAGNFQFLNPFTQVQFYFLNANTGEWTLAGSTTAPVVTDNATATQRTFTWTLAGFTPPAGLPTGPLKIIAVGVNAAGDALATNFSTTVSLTNP